MKEGWKTVKLGDVCDFFRGLTYGKTDEVDFSSNIVLRSNNIELKSFKLNLAELKYISDDIVIPSEKRVKKGSLLICTANGSKEHLGKVALIDKDFNYAFGGFMGLLLPSEEILAPYLYYMMLSDSYKKYIKSLSDGANINNLKFKDLAVFELPLPPLEEQHRIVSILDASFEKIDALKKNAEENLKNAKALFQQVLAQELKPKDGGDYRKLDSLYLIKTGKLNSNQAVKNGKYPFFTCSREIFAINEYAFDCEAVLLAGNNASGDFNVKHYKGKFNAYQRTYVIQPKTDLAGCRLLYYVLLLYLSELKSLSLGANTKFLKIGMIENIKVPILNSNEHRIVATLDTLSEKCRRLEQVAQQTIRECDALKQSILRQAFSGEL